MKHNWKCTLVTKEDKLYECTICHLKAQEWSDYTGFYDNKHPALTYFESCANRIMKDILE